MYDFFTSEILRANEMPAPTWHRLDVNDAEISVASNNPQHVANYRLPQIKAGLVAMGCELEVNNMEFGEMSAFDEVLQSFENENETDQASKRAVEIAVSEKTDPHDLDIPALSTYQKRAVLNEMNASPARFFEMGAGIRANRYMSAMTGKHTTLIAHSDKPGDATLYIHPQGETPSCVFLDVIATENSECNITVIYENDAEVEHEKNSSSYPTYYYLQERQLVSGCSLRIFAGHNAKVNVNMVQALTTNTPVIDSSGYSLCAGASVNVEHRVLGGARTVTGLAADMHGDASTLNVTTRYIGVGLQRHDFNYSVKQRGRNTTSNIDANGVLTAKSEKTLRGTIDFVHGCKGSVGNERETVLLASEDAKNETEFERGRGREAEQSKSASGSTNNDANANNSTELERGDARAGEAEEHDVTEDRNTHPANSLKTECKTVPVILCDEEDVAGNHGATIGHVRPEARFYLNARGLNDAQIEHLFLSSFIDEARATFADNERVLAQIDAFTNKVGICAQD
jgi:Fe-S cluster assembly protein SufD